MSTKVREPSKGVSLWLHEDANRINELHFGCTLFAYTSDSRARESGKTSAEQFFSEGNEEVLLSACAAKDFGKSGQPGKPEM
jgi:hypothetical protein